MTGKNQSNDKIPFIITVNTHSWADTAQYWKFLVLSAVLWCTRAMDVEDSGTPLAVSALTNSVEKELTAALVAQVLNAEDKEAGLTQLTAHFQQKGKETRLLFADVRKDLY